ncbi:enoyl-CoA hydratase/isomerase family protein [Nocardia jiangxiensis]|uniref:enoyl-CoA hydratase/isomerase family protein n=1 Tax=Nocardia jiangxiensis TaxID=282685 RepID=UPI00068527D6|nr:enoyl-CoA hydratase/isomerase family protein [Nocardia jiangxiensis]
MAGVRVEDNDGARWIRFDRPEKRNALRIEDVESIRAAVNQAPGEGCSSIVFTGGVRDFSAGADVSGFRATPADSALDVSGDSPGQRMLQEVRTCQLPTIAAIEGYCVGLAMDLTAVCDIRVASRSARFSMPEVKIGLPVIGEASLFERYIGLTRAKEMLLTGRWYSAEQMADWGYLNQLTDIGEAEKTAQPYVDEFRRLPARTLAAQKRIFEAWLQLPQREASRVSILEYAVTTAHPETRRWVEQYKTTRSNGSKA